MNTNEEEYVPALPPLDLGAAAQRLAPAARPSSSSSSCQQQQGSARSTEAAASTCNPLARDADACEQEDYSEEDDHEKEDMDLSNEEEEEEVNEDDDVQEILPDHAASDKKVAAAGKKRKTEAAKGGDDDDHAFIQVRRRRKRLGPDERQEITDIMDHMITEGNFWRHHNWRLSQWKRGLGQQPLAVPTSVARATTGTTGTATANSDESNEQVDNDDYHDKSSKPQAKTTSKSNKIRTASEAGPDGDDSTTFKGVLMHAGDARIYPHNSRFCAGREPRAWPWPPRRTTGMVEASDRQWDVEYGDGIHPVAFSMMRLSAAVPAASPPNLQPSPLAFNDDNNGAASSPFPPLNFDLDPAGSDGQQVLERDAARVMLLRCWERAVHAASSTVVVDTAGADSSCSATRKAVAAAAAPPPSARHQPRTRDAAIEACQRLEIDPFHEEEEQQQQQEGDPKQTYTCCSCGIQRSTKESLEDHFYGNVTTNGCCWTLIERKQRNTIAKVLENEASNQTQQLMRTILMDALQMEDAPNSFGCFDILKLVTDKFDKSRILRKSWASATAQRTGKNADSSGVVTETLEVSLDEPPLHINQCVIDALRSRLVDRYAEVPR